MGPRLAWESPAQRWFPSCDGSASKPHWIRCAPAAGIAARRSLDHVRLTMHRPRIFIIIAIAGATIAFTGCARPPESARAPYVPLAEVEATYGALITAGNHPTLDQHGTGERVGLFRDASGEVWGLPLTAASNGSVLAC